MGDKTGIEWTDATWNPVTGCTKVSQGCKHCYAERVFPRAYGKDRKFTDVRTHPDRLAWPLRWKRPRRIFVNSMSDLFHEDVPDSFIETVFGVMARAQQHTFQILTKRPARMLEWFGHSMRGGWCAWAPFMDLGLPAPVADTWPGWPLPNVWLGVSVEDQATADERIPLLINAPAAVLWISAEPLLGPIDLYRYISGYVVAPPLLDWVVAGGESGPGARPMHPDWARSLRDQCKAGGVPFLFKQWGEWVSLSEVEGPGEHFNFADGAGVRRTGKRLAGRKLDGRLHDEYPA